MIDALGSPGSLLLVGGTSDIAVATAHRYLAERPLRVVVAARDTPRRSAVADELRTAGGDVEVVDFDAEDAGSAERMVAAAAAGGDIDVAVIAFGQLGDQEQLAADPAAAAALGQVNYVAPVVVGTVLANRMRTQGHGVIVALSSVAGERARRSNYVYGSTKAGIDAYFSGPRGLAGRLGRLGARRPAGVRPLEDDRGPARGAAVHHAGGGGRGDRHRRPQGPAHGVGPRRDALGDERAPAHPARGLPPPALLGRFQAQRLRACPGPAAAGTAGRCPGRAAGARSR